MIATHQLHERLTARADEFVGMLFADGAKRCGNAWRVEKRGSLVINIDRASIVFFDHECGEGGDAVSLYARERGRTAGDALKELAAWVGLAPSLDLLAPEPRKITSKTAKAVPGMIPAEVSAAWTEGSRYLWPNGRDLNRGGVEKLAHWRGWPARFVETLVRCGAIALPKYYGTRTAAGFMVCEPVPWSGEDFAHRDRPRFVGWHGRLTGDQGWRYSPKGLRTMPMILAGCGALGSIWDKRLLLITEGQWDGLTLALTAGWYDEALGLLAIPDHVAMSHCAALVAGRNGLRLTSHT